MLANTCFICRLKPHCEVSNALKKWHIAYHGTSVGTLRRTLDHNQLLPGMEKTPMLPFVSDFWSLVSVHVS